MPRFKSRPPARTSKKRSSSKWSSNSSHSGTDDDYDLEKTSHGPGDLTHDDESDSLPSSPATADAYAPMLRRTGSNTRTVTAYDSKHRFDRRKCHRYFTIGLASILILFILTLTRMSYKSREILTTIAPPPPAPPLYEKFPFLQRYHGGIRTLVSRSENEPEYPDREMILEMLERIKNASMLEDGVAPRSRRRDEGHQIPPSKLFDPLAGSASGSDIVECFLDANANIRVPQPHAYDGVVNGFPEPIMGSYDLLGLNGNVCFDRYGRYGPYGYGYTAKLGGIGAGLEGDTEGSEVTWARDGQIDFRGIKWADAQARCMEANKHRFETGTAPVKRATSWWNSEKSAQMDTSRLNKEKSNATPRHAVIIRTWSDFKFDPEDIVNLRSLISELSLASGTQYVVHFLVHVKDINLPIWSDDEVHQRVLNESLPEEFRGMGTLWSEKQMALIYAGLQETNYRNLGVYGVYRSTYMPLQYFAHQHPEYDFFWHWELDIRYIGHYLHLFEQVGQWAKQQPRKELWERNGRFYIPTEHGSWEDFRQMVRVQTEHGTGNKNNIWSKYGNSQPDSPATNILPKPIWGSLPPSVDDLDHGNDPQPPTTQDKDKYEWGVGEEADFITFNPLFDPDSTGWILAEDVTGYNLEKGYPPRRTAIITASRLSRRLLDTMHRETSLRKHTMFSEMWPGSCALHHGYKAVYVPHPEYIDRAWPPDYLAATFNGGLHGASGGARTSPFNDFNQRNFLGVTWYYHAGFSPNLFHRWLGFKVNNDGGPEFELEGEGRMCLPAMLLHPVKQVDLMYEKTPEQLEEEKKEQEAAAAADAGEQPAA